MPILLGDDQNIGISLGDSSNVYAFLGDVLLYPIGNPVIYIIDGNSYFRIEYVEKGQSCLSPSFTPSKRGWDFIGWGEQDSFDTYEEYIMGDEKDIVLFAVYQKKVKLSYNGNGNTNVDVGMDSDTSYAYYNANETTEEASFTVSENAFVKTGYLFENWRLDSVDGTIVKPGDTLNLTKDAILYANWIFNPEVKDNTDFIYTTRYSSNEIPLTYRDIYTANSNEWNLSSYYGWALYAGVNSSANGSFWLHIRLNGHKKIKIAFRFGGLNVQPKYTSDWQEYYPVTARWNVSRSVGGNEVVSYNSALTRGYYRDYILEFTEDTDLWMLCIIETSNNGIGTACGAILYATISD